MKGTSHRARIPSTINWQFKINTTSSLYTLNVSSGRSLFFFDNFKFVLFVGQFIETLENEEVRVERRLFASQEYSELLLVHVVSNLIISLICITVLSHSRTFLVRWR